MSDQDNPLWVLVFYGGDTATNLRNELLAWLRGPHIGADARLVAETAPHTEGAVDDRVDCAIEWADAAIAIITPDERTEYGAPNVIDEIGRWRGRKTKRTLCIVRQKGTKEYSNHNGIIYVGFESRIKEVFEDLRVFFRSVTDELLSDVADISNPDLQMLVEDCKDALDRDRLVDAIAGAMYGYHSAVEATRKHTGLLHIEDVVVHLGVDLRSIERFRSGTVVQVGVVDSGRWNTVFCGWPTGWDNDKARIEAGFMVDFLEHTVAAIENKWPDALGDVRVPGRLCQRWN